MNFEISEELSEIKRAILATVQAEYIYLFGSYAYGTPDSESDLDIYVTIPNGEVRPLIAMQRIGQALYKIQKRPVDLLVQRKSKFNELKSAPGLEQTIFSKGIKLNG